MPAAVPFISLEDVSVRLRDGRALRHVHWQIRSDQTWAVVGPNGGGKSTLMKALCGRAPVAGGRIVYHFADNGRPPQDQIAYVAFDAQMRAAQREGVYHQARWNAGIDPGSLSVADYLSEGRVQERNPYQVTNQRPDPALFLAHRQQVVELLGIEALLDRGLWQVSNGERRKVKLAEALLKQPRLLILDNPFTGLDAGFRARLAALIGGSLPGETCVVVVANGPDELPTSISHVLVVDNGQVVAQGPRDLGLNSAWPRQSLPPHPNPAVPARCLPPRGEGVISPPLGKGPGEGGILVQMQGVNVAYGGVQVLSEIDWTVRPGERWALLGPNGAGKTTLLSLILGDNPQAYANDVTLFDRRRGSGESIWEIKRQIGWVAPELHLTYPRGVTCLEVVCSGFFDSVGLHRRPSPEQRAAARRWMERLGLSQYEVRAFGELSEGLQRLLLLARAVVKEPALLVLDEPCQGLDAAHRDRVLHIVDAIGARLDSSLIYVTHDSHALPASISHLLRLDRGRVKSRERVLGNRESGIKYKDT
jgi:molybdate transport system ATP-binding protein